MGADNIKGAEKIKLYIQYQNVEGGFWKVQTPFGGLNLLYYNNKS